MSALPTPFAFSENPADHGMLARLGALFERLDERGVRCCLWKKSLQLPEIIHGNGPLDLLVAERDMQAARLALLEAGFAGCREAGATAPPGESRYLGLDEATGRLLTVVIRSRIFSGDRFQQSWALPLEKMLLDGRRKMFGVPLPSKETELIGCVVRNMISHATLPDLLLILRSGRGPAAEYRHLTGEIDLQRTAELLQQHLPEIGFDTFLRGLVLLGRDEMTIPRALVGKKFKRALQKYRRRPGPSRLLLATAAMLRTLWRRKRHHEGLEFQTGGRLIAVVGATAAERSAFTAALEKWLGSVLAVQTIDFGEPSFLSPGLALFTPTPNYERAAGNNISNAPPHSRLTGARLRRAWRATRRGRLVITAGFPGSGSARDRRNSIPPPDLVIELAPAAEAANQQNDATTTTAEPQDLFTRALPGTANHPLPSIRVRAGQSSEQMVAAIRIELWRWLAQ